MMILYNQCFMNIVHVSSGKKESCVSFQVLRFSRASLFVPISIPAGERLLLRPRQYHELPPESVSSFQTSILAQPLYVFLYYKCKGQELVCVTLCGGDKQVTRRSVSLLQDYLNSSVCYKGIDTVFQRAFPFMECNYEESRVVMCSDGGVNGGCDSLTER